MLLLWDLLLRNNLKGQMCAFIVQGEKQVKQLSETTIAAALRNHLGGYILLITVSVEAFTHFIFCGSIQTVNSIQNLSYAFWLAQQAFLKIKARGGEKTQFAEICIMELNNN